MSGSGGVRVMDWATVEPGVRFVGMVLLVAYAVRVAAVVLRAAWRVWHR